MADPSPQSPRTALVRAKLNVRNAPAATADRVDRLEPGTRIEVHGIVTGKPFLDKDAWYVLAGANRYCWAGGAILEDAAPPLQPPAAPNGLARVRLRANQTILPLTATELNALYGPITTHPDPKHPGGVQVTAPANWQQTVTPYHHPVLATIAPRGLHLHVKAQPHFQKVFDQIQSRPDLVAQLVTYDGSYVPRHISWNPDNALSSHTWGVAIDLNARWNGYNQQPALPGQRGCLRDLVAVFNQHGFAWGGHFTKPDGMHFELALLQP